ncbi:hypothetical protein I79_015132 [Cricetulus griseus]|uniref:Uncharacterized protein n=1 Tax=Cricetulus griseus TaxID=10029 RepID=G3HVY6_CRIGR|nr:hypothetical protein I79_015132 [Cricetulus griseus]
MTTDHKGNSGSTGRPLPNWDLQCGPVVMRQGTMKYHLNTKWMRAAPWCQGAAQSS